MIGLIDCRSQNFGKSWAGMPLEELEAFDRPLLQHAVEQMLQSGVTHCVVIAEDPDAITQRWGNGERWGCQLSSIEPQQITTFLASQGNVPVLTGRGDCIPCIAGRLSTEAAGSKGQLVYAERKAADQAESFFTGWALTDSTSLLVACFATQGASGLLNFLGNKAAAFQASSCLHAETPEGFLLSQQAVLEDQTPEVIYHGFELRDGVWVGRGAYLHPSVTVEGKVFLGENVRVCRGVKLVGPVVICRDSVIDVGATLNQASVQPGTYFGRKMHACHDVVFPGSIVHARTAAVTGVENPAVLSHARMGMLEFAGMMWGLLRRKPRNARDRNLYQAAVAVSSAR